jgi:hypothetical protein
VLVVCDDGSGGNPDIRYNSRVATYRNTQQRFVPISCVRPVQVHLATLREASHGPVDGDGHLDKTQGQDGMFEHVKRRFPARA